MSKPSRPKDLPDNVEITKPKPAGAQTQDSGGTPEPPPPPPSPPSPRDPGGG